MKCGITIDFDFFVPEKSTWDLGHQESPFFLEDVWMLRNSLRSEIQTDGYQKIFWETLKKHVPVPIEGSLYVSDSHAFGFEVLKDCDVVVLFDRHHDCWHPHDPKKKHIYCDDWGYIFLSTYPHSKILWVQPCTGVDNIYQLPSRKPPRNRIIPITFETLREKLQQETSPISELTLHVCRSGCWVPPWLDTEFLAFLSSSGLEISRLQHGRWNPTRPRSLRVF